MAERAVCARCRRPEIVCYCRHVRPLATRRTRVLLLQHPRERRMGVGTARMAHLALPGSVLRVGTDFAADPVVRAALAPDAPPAWVLFPAPDACDVSELPRDRPLTLVVLDGTWTLAAKLRKLNPALAALPHVAFVPTRPSDYRIRRQPRAGFVSTIEALAEVLDLLEPDAGPFAPLLEPFRAMVDRQEAFVRDVHARRHNHTRASGRDGAPRCGPAARLAAELAAAWPRVVCVQGEANAWPARDPRHQPPEIVQWLAHRPATGETFEALVAPRRPLAPSAARHAEVSEALLATGGSAEAWRAAWARFTRPDDLLVTWGTFYTAIAAADGLSLAPGPQLATQPATQPAAAATQPAGLFDLRARLARIQRPRARSVEECAAAIGAAAAGSPAPPFGLPGRAGRRLAALVQVAERLRAGALSDRT